MPGDEQRPTSSSSEGGASGKIDRLKIIGGLVALGAGLVALLLVVVVSLLVKPDTTGGSIATSAIGVIGSIVGAYFGVKIGSDGTQGAIKAQKQEAINAQVYALNTPPEAAERALAQIAALAGLQASPPGK
jgi:uncharacterized membrane protein YeaQ/YmgE (transglycosylase-associated protein family)